MFFFEELSSLVADVERRSDENLELLYENVNNAIEGILYMKHDLGSLESLENLLVMFQVISQELFREIHGHCRRIAILSSSHRQVRLERRGKTKMYN